MLNGDGIENGKKNSNSNNSYRSKGLLTWRWGTPDR